MMLTVSLQEIAETLAVEFEGSSSAEGVTGLCVDSRQVSRGDLFVALPGQRTSGERFITEAMAGGAAAVLASPTAAPGDTVFRVDDPVVAMGHVAALVRARFEGPVVGITGTAGKTSVKEFLRTLVPARLRGVFPRASFNNSIGVPLTLAGLEENSELLVVEIGTSAPGEIAALCALSRPTIGVLTSVGPGHLEGLGTIEGVLEEKLALAAALPEGGPVFINSENDHLRSATWPDHVKVQRVALDSTLGDLVPHDTDGVKTFVLGPDGPEIASPVHGRVGLLNLWLAVCVARHLSCTDQEIAEGSRNLRAPSLRGEQVTCGKARLLLDCYNANPLSMAAALSEFGRMPGPRSVVLGEMLELGSGTSTHHRDLGRVLARIELETVLFIGKTGPAVLEGFVEAGGSADAVQLFPDVESAREAFARLTEQSVLVLLKGSRGIALERLLESEDD